MSDDSFSVLLEVAPTRAPSAWPAGVDPAFDPVPLAARTRRGSATLVLRADTTRARLESLRAAPGVIAVWSDPVVAPVAPEPTPAEPIDCTPQRATGAAADVARLLGAEQVWAASGFRGAGVVIGVVDGGVDAARFPVVGGWSPDPASPPGSARVAWEGHGNMCAFDARIACPEARFHDYSIGKTTPGAGIGGLLSSALQSFHRALVQFGIDRTPQLLSNSWGLYQESWDPAPPGDPANYTRNPDHPFTRKFVEVIDAGLLVCFAAGNCGGVCADPRCGADQGPGRGIWGASGHERSICVGAVNLRREWIGYSSEGPAALSPDKPDVCGYSHFAGFFASDNGTSAACPVVAGVLGLLAGARQASDPAQLLRQDQARQLLRASVGGAWQPRLGAGIVDAHAAWRALAGA